MFSFWIFYVPALLKTFKGFVLNSVIARTGEVTGMFLATLFIR